jgi:MFS family permease
MGKVMPGSTSQSSVVNPSTPPPVPAKPTFLQKFTVLKSAQRELWLIFILKFVNIAAYGMMNSTLKLWLSSDFGYTDKQSLGIVATWSLSMTAFTLLVGSLTDAIGLRRTFFIGAFFCIFTRLVMAFATVKWMALAFGLFPLALGEALGTPVLVAAVRRYSTTSQRSISFSVFYAMMNVGFLIAAYGFDFLRQEPHASATVVSGLWHKFMFLLEKLHLGEHGHVILFGQQLSTYRVLFLVSLVFEASQLPIIYMLRKGAEATDEGVKIVPETPKYPNESFWKASWLTTRDTFKETVRLLGELVGQNGFYRLLAFLILIAFLKLILMQMYYVFPTFGIRELGDGAKVGRLWAINSYLIILLVPIVGALTQRFSAYRMVIFGGIICAISVFVMALPTAWFQGAANGSFGNFIAHWYLGLTGPVHPYYPMIAIFVIVLSVGEAFYSPRVYEYAASIAPRGQEASYSALSYVPFLLAKLLIGTFAGMLLESYCPPQGPRNSGMMWLAIGLTACIAPIGLVLLRRFIRVHEAGRKD